MVVVAGHTKRKNATVSKNKREGMQHLSSTMQSYQIDDRRKRVAKLLAQSMTETEMAHNLGVHVSTISRDIKALKEQIQRFVYDLAKSDLAYYYKQCIDGIEEVKRKAWEAYRSTDPSLSLKPKNKLLALKLAKECDEAKFALFKDSPSIMNLKSLEERLIKIESGQINQ
ncbi:MAG TPA: HTH domain-containing protein [Nitrososphaeraceae archaeon]